jgi:hypothetical protein
MALNIVLAYMRNIFTRVSKVITVWFGALLTPVLARSLKLSNIALGQFWLGDRMKHTVCFGREVVGIGVGTTASPTLQSTNDRRNSKRVAMRTGIGFFLLPSRLV